jgi:hypothetical protein
MPGVKPATDRIVMAKTVMIATSIRIRIAGTKNRFAEVDFLLMRGLSTMDPLISEESVQQRQLNLVGKSDHP